MKADRGPNVNVYNACNRVEKFQKRKHKVKEYKYEMIKVRILFEFQGVSKPIAYEAAKLGVRKLPMQTKFVSLEKK